MGEKKTIRTFTDLDAWKEGHKIVLMVYKITGNFPKEEVFGLTSQVRRCFISITSNIAEGFSRRSYKDKVQFYSIAMGSLTELQSQIITAKDIGFTTDEEFQKNNGSIRGCSQNPFRIDKVFKIPLSLTHCFAHNSVSTIHTFWP